MTREWILPYREVEKMIDNAEWEVTSPGETFIRRMSAIFAHQNDRRATTDALEAIELDIFLKSVGMVRANLLRKVAEVGDSDMYHNNKEWWGRRLQALDVLLEEATTGHFWKSRDDHSF